MKCPKCGNDAVSARFTSKGRCVLVHGDLREGSDEIDDFDTYGPYECLSCQHEWDDDTSEKKEPAKKEPTYKFRVCGTATLEIEAEVTGCDAEDAANELDCTLNVDPDEAGVTCDYSVGGSFTLGSSEDLGLADPDAELEEGEEPDHKYKVNGTLEVEVHLYVEADSEEDALSTVESMSWSFDESLTVLSCDQTGFEVDSDVEISNLQWERWDERMSKEDRIKFLKGIGCSDDCAYEIAARESYDVPEEWMMQLEA